MSDVWSSVAELDATLQERLAGVLETRGADPQQQALRRAFLEDIPFPEQAHVLEVGCGTGVLTRVIARHAAVAEVVGVDPAGSLLDKARELSAGQANIRYQEADGRELPFDDGSFEVVIFDSTLCHIPGPEAALAEAYRVLRPGGTLAAFDGDYATTTVALGDHDPLQPCVDVMMANSVNDRWLVRKLPRLAREAGFTMLHQRSHGFVETTEGGYMLTVVDRGIDMLHNMGQITADTAATLRAEARYRVEIGTFFGHIAYGSVVAVRDWVTSDQRSEQ
jgi:ubiquinone/menaquinone biosynthesis C-methylase UbiE